MAVRATMSALISRVRLMIYDTATPQMFQDQDIQDKLDECRQDIRYEVLVPKPTFTTAGIQYNDYYSRSGMWETDEVLIWGDFSTLTPTTSDELVGHWTFNNQYPPVLIAGKQYDIYRAAADLLDYKVANLSATVFDFTTDGQSFKVSQQLDFLEKRIKDYRHKQRAVTAFATRIDSNASRMPGVSARQERLAGPVSAEVPFLTGE